VAALDSGGDVLAEAARRVGQGEPVVLATAVRTDGNPPCRPGLKLLVGAGGPLAGTLGCSDFDRLAADAAPGLLASGEPVLVTFEHDLGRVDVYLEPLRPRPRLVVLGATPVAEYVLRWGRDLGYDTLLVEDRQDRITPAHRAAADGIVGSLDGVALGDDTDAVHTDHDAPGLPDQLARLLRARVRFVGVMGSRRHTASHLAVLRDLGVAPGDIDRLQTPVGLDLGGRSPAEIALSILAGMVASRHGRTGGLLAARSSAPAGATGGTPGDPPTPG
jgi:xanthine dehydrogenase accessory factor